MKKYLLAAPLVFLGESAALATPSLRYNQPPLLTRTALPANNVDMTGAIPGPALGAAAPRQGGLLVTKSGVAPPPTFAAPCWTGFNLGVHVGAGWANTRLEVPGIANFSGVGMWGATGGVTVGFDYQFSPRFVAGVIAEGNVNGARATGSIAGLGEANFRESASWALRGRLGTLTSDETMVYVTAGVSEIFTNLTLPNTLAVTGGGARYMAAVFGAGIETHLGGGLYGRVEYLHGLYARHRFAGGLFNALPDTGLARVGLIFKPADWAASAVSSAPPLRESWTGPYAGLQLGWGWESTRLSRPVWSADGVGGTGPIGGLLVGYEYQFGNSVAALEADGSASGVRSTLDVSGFAFAANAQIRYDWDYSLRARFGRLFGNTLAFGTAGWSQTEGRLATMGFGGINTSRVFSGVQFGGGLETMVTPRIGARVEYLHTFYDKYANVLGLSIDARPTAGKARAAVIFKF